MTNSVILLYWACDLKFSGSVNLQLETHTSGHLQSKEGNKNQLFMGVVMRALIIAMVSLFCISEVIADGPSFGGTRVIFSRNNENTMFASINGNANAYGLFKTTDGGNSWYLQASEHDDLFVIAPSNANLIYGSNHRSTDGGDTWQEYDGQPIMAVHPTYGNTLIGMYALLYGASSYKISTNGGDNWESNTIPGFNRYPYCSSSNDGLYLLVTSDGIWEYYLYYSDDGSNWIQIGVEIPMTTSAFPRLTINPSNPQHIAIIYGQYVLFSTDRGNTWTQSDYFYQNVINIYCESFLQPNSTTFFAGTSDGLYKTDNLGSSWQFISCKAGKIMDIDYLPSSSNIAFAADQINISTDNGASWKNVGVVYTGFSYDVLNSSYNNIFCSNTNYLHNVMASDNDIDWFPVFGQARSFKCNSNASALSAQSVQYDHYISSDGGNSWSVLPEPLFDFWAMYPASSSILYGYASVDEIFCISTDGGESWTNRPIPSSSYMFDITSKLSDPYSLFVQCGYDLYFTNDGSISWNIITPEFEYHSSISGFCVQQSGNILYAFASSDLAKSADDGSSWDIVYDDYAGYSFMRLATHPTNGDIIYGIGRHSPDYVDRPIVSYDGGVSWTMAYPNEELAPGPKLCVDLAYPDFAYFTGVDGIIRLDMSGFTDVSDGVSTPRDHELISVYPNPFNSSAIVDYNLQKDSFVKIAVYDILGHKLETLIARKQPAGNHKIVWNATNKPSGIYFIRIQAGEFSANRKLLLLK